MRIDELYLVEKYIAYITGVPDIVRSNPAVHKFGIQLAWSHNLIPLNLLLDISKAEREMEPVDGNECN